MGGIHCMQPAYYNQATSKLAFHSNETSKAVNNIYLAIYYCHAKLHKNKKSLWWKTLIYWIDICCRCTLELPQWGNSNVYLQHMLLKLRKPILKCTRKQVSCPLSLPLLNFPNCKSVLKYLSLYHKLFIFVWQLYLQIRIHELPLC